MVEAYRNAAPGAHPCPACDWVTFTSSSTVANFLAMAGREALQGVRIASIGPVTSGTVRASGFEVDAEARPYTTDGLIDAILDHEAAAGLT